MVEEKKPTEFTFISRIKRFGGSYYLLVPKNVFETIANLYGIFEDYQIVVSLRILKQLSTTYKKKKEGE